MSRQDYIFGYGSLMSHDSRLRFSDIDATGIPAFVSGWRRGWSMSCPIENFTCVGAQPQKSEISQNSSDSRQPINGMLFPVPAITENLQKREKNYHFRQVALTHIEVHADHSHHEVALQESTIWICEIKRQGKAQDGFPIYQSYVDTCISGCLEHVDESFAIDFVTSTEGWTGHWLNDRENKQYPRAANITADMAKRIDALLADHDLLKYRKDVE